MTYNIDRINTEIVSVTPEMARHLRDSCQYERQRPLSDSHITRLATEIAKGRFIEGTQVHICKVKQNAYLINGNHTMEAIAQSGYSVPLTMLYTECKNEKEVADIYMRHDIHRARDWAAAFRAAGLFEKIAESKQVVNAFGSAMKLIMLGFAYVQASGGSKVIGGSPQINEIASSRDLRVQAMDEYKEYCELYCICLHKAPKPMQFRMRRAAVFAVALETFRYQPSLAAEFWEGVAKDDGLRNGDPRKTLLRYLTDNPAGAARATYARGVASAWNAYFAKEELSILRVPQEGRFKLAGTPWGTDKAPKPVAAMAAVTKPATKLLKLGTEVTSDGPRRVAMIGG